MREEIAYREMQEEKEREARDKQAAASAPKAPESEGTASHGSAPDPAAKERAYPHLPGEGTPR